MNTLLHQGPIRLIWLLMAFLALILCSCRRNSHGPGESWTHPDDEAMPLAFSPGEQMPTYARAWHMPEGFQGFPKQWNQRVRIYLEQQIQTHQEEAAWAWMQSILSLPGSKRNQMAHVRFQSAVQTLRTLGSRLQMGDYLTFRREIDMPRHLEWQEGLQEPELGSPKATKGGTLRLALQRSFPNTLRPFGPNSNNATRRYVYDDIELQLVRLHPGTGAIIPGTADRWAISPDQRTVYFHLDENARFSDGSPLTTRDFITALYVRTSPHSAEPFYADFYLSNFSHITVYSNHIIAVTLTTPRPYAAFYAAIPASCTPFYAEFGPDYPTRYLWRVPPTTGGYTVEPGGVELGQKITLSRVRNWWAAERRYTRYSCNVDSIVYSFLSETSKVRELFRIGEIDALPARDSDFWYEGLEIEPVHRGFIQRIRFYNMWPRNCFGFHLNTSRPPFNNSFLRQGFHHSLNIQAVINSLFRGDATQNGSYFSGFGPYSNESLLPREYSPEQARDYFARAGYIYEGDDGILHRKDGTRLQVVVSARIDPLYADFMNMLREDAARCGLDLRLEQMDDTLLYVKVKQKQFDAALFSWGFSPPLPDPGTFFLSQYAYNDDGTPARGTNNITATASPELDQAILASKAATTHSQAVAAHHRVQQLIADTCSWVPAWSTDYWRFAQWRWLRWPDTPECRFCPPNYYDPLDSHLYWIDEQEKKETLHTRANGGSYPETEWEIPLPSPS